MTSLLPCPVGWRQVSGPVHIQKTGIHTCSHEHQEVGIMWGQNLYESFQYLLVFKNFCLRLFIHFALPWLTHLLINVSVCSIHLCQGCCVLGTMLGSVERHLIQNSKLKKKGTVTKLWEQMVLICSLVGEIHA